MGLRLLSDKYYVGVLLKIFLGIFLFVGGAVLGYYWQVFCFLLSFLGIIILFLPIRITVFCPHCKKYLKLSLLGGGHRLLGLIKFCSFCGETMEAKVVKKKSKENKPALKEEECPLQSIEVKETLHVETEEERKQKLKEEILKELNLKKEPAPAAPVPEPAPEPVSESEPTPDPLEGLDIIKLEEGTPIVVTGKPKGEDSSPSQKTLDTSKKSVERELLDMLDLEEDK